WLARVCVLPSSSNLGPFRRHRGGEWSVRQRRQENALKALEGSAVRGMQTFFGILRDIVEGDKNGEKEQHIQKGLHTFTPQRRNETISNWGFVGLRAAAARNSGSSIPERRKSRILRDVIIIRYPAEPITFFGVVQESRACPTAES